MKSVFTLEDKYDKIPQMFKERNCLSAENLERYDFNKFFSEHKPSFDIDGVIIDSLSFVTELFNKEHKTNYLPTDMRSFRIVNSWLYGLGYSEEYTNKKEHEYWYGERLLEAPLKAGAKEFLESLNSKGIDVAVVSSRPGSLIAGTTKVLMDNIPFLKEENIFMQLNSEMPGEIYKAFIINKKGIGIHFEDWPDHAKTILDYTGSMIGLMSNMDGLKESYYDRRIIRFKGKTPFLPPDFNDVLARFK